MSLTVSASSGSNFAPIEPGTYPAVCYGLIDIGLQVNETFKKLSPNVIVMWEIPSETIDVNGEEVSRTINKTYTMSLNEKATLRRDLIAWRGRDFTDEELNGFDLHNIVGSACLLNIVHTERNGSTYANISAIMKLPKGMEKPKATRDLITFDMDTDSLEVINQLPEWIQKRIKESESYDKRIEERDDKLNGLAEFVENNFAADESELPF